MSLQQLTVYFRTKGSSKSGNYGHAGRPGKRGGSSTGGSGSTVVVQEDSPGWLAARLSVAPSTSSLTGIDIKSSSKLFPPYRTPEQVLQSEAFSWLNGNTDMELYALNTAVERYGELGKGIVRYVDGLSSYKDEQTGNSFGRIDVIKLDSGNIKVSANILNSYGKKVGMIDRIFRPSAKEVHHSLMEFDDHSYHEMRKGFGTRFYQASEAAYKASGYATVTLQANSDVGGYAWARLGFTENIEKLHAGKFKPQTNKLIQASLNMYEDAYGTKPAKLPKTLLEVATLTGPDGRRIGKESLLGTDWYGIKRLEDSDPGYQAGLAYYKSKGAIV